MEGTLCDNGDSMIQYPRCSITPDMVEADIGKALSLCPDDRCLKHQSPIERDSVLAWVSDKDLDHNGSGVVLVKQGLVRGLLVSEDIRPGADVRLNTTTAMMECGSNSGEVIGLTTDTRWRFSPVLGQSGRVVDYAIPGSRAWTHVFNENTSQRSCHLFARHRQGWGGYKVEVGHRRAVVNDTDDDVLVYADVAKTDLLATVASGGRSAWMWNGVEWEHYAGLLRIADVMLL